MTSTRRRFLTTTAAASAAVLAPGLAAASSTPAASQPTTPRAALAEALAGNARFAAGHVRGPHRSSHRRHVQAAGQTPWFAVLGCSDSRVVPELLFDTGIGDVFDARVAGNVVDDHVVGSLEFAIEHYDVPLLIVLGHERCGAVAAAVEIIGKPGASAPTPAIGSLVESIRPAVEAVAGRPGDRVEHAVVENVRRSAAEVVARSPTLAARVQNGTLAVRGARYDLESGRVRLLRQ